MHETIDSEGLRLAAHLARPPGFARVPGLILSHGFPVGPRGDPKSTSTYPELADRLARETGWAVLVFNFRGTGASEGDFSLDGWLADLDAAVGALSERADVGGVWLAGSSLGGSVSILLAADDERVRGVATLGAPASFSEWAAHPDHLLADARALGLIRHHDFPPDPEAWGRRFAELSPTDAAARLAPRSLLVVHGDCDEVVPVADARALHGAASGHSQVRVVAGAGHRLRHDPRAVALLIGWMTRQSP